MSSSATDETSALAVARMQVWGLKFRVWGLEHQPPRFMGSCNRRGKHQVESSQFRNNFFTEMCSGSEAGLYVRRRRCVSLNSRLETNNEEYQFGFEVAGGRHVVECER